MGGMLEEESQEGSKIKDPPSLLQAAKPGCLWQSEGFLWPPFSLFVSSCMYQPIPFIFINRTVIIKRQVLQAISSTMQKKCPFSNNPLCQVLTHPSLLGDLLTLLWRRVSVLWNMHSKQGLRCCQWGFLSHTHRVIPWQQLSVFWIKGGKDQSFLIVFFLFARAVGRGPLSGIRGPSPDSPSCSQH